MTTSRLYIMCLLIATFGALNASTSRVNLPGLIATESSGNPSAQGDYCVRTSTYRSLGLGQLGKAAWADVNTHLGWSYEYDRWVMDGTMNERYTDAYANVVIPKYLKHFGIPDSEAVRLVAYKYGIGRVRTFYREYQAGWDQACRDRLGRQWTVYERIRDEQANRVEVPEFGVRP